MPADWEWLTSLIGIVTVASLIAAGLAWERFVANRRLLIVLVAALGAAQLATSAVYGIGAEFEARFPKAAIVAFRMLCAAGSLWATYLTFGVFRMWLRIGDKPEDES